MFRFGSDAALYTYLLVPLLMGFLWYALRRKRKAIERFGNPELIAKLSLAVSARGQLVKVVLVVTTVLLLVTALARPQFGTRVETVRRRGRDIVIALDVSASMLAEDITPNRLEKAKHAIGSLLERLDGDRVGLVAFAGRAFVQSPLTLDYGAASMFLNAMDPDLIPVPGTNLGEALDESLDALAAGELDNKVMIVITDGEDHEGEIDASIERARDDGVMIYTVGMGSPDGVPIPTFNASGGRSGFLRDDEGAIVTTRLDEATLERISRATGGSYYRATAGESELTGLADEIAGVDSQELDARQVTQFEEQYQVFLGLALLLLAVEMLVPERRRVVSIWQGRFR